MPALVFPGVDLDLEFEGLVAGLLGGELENERGRSLALNPLPPPEPRERFLNSVDHRPDRLRSSLHEVDILGIAERLSEHEFVDRRAATKCNPVADCLAGEEIAQGAGDDQILLHLPEIGPGARRRSIVGCMPVGSCVDFHGNVDREFPELISLFTSRQRSCRRLVRRVKQLERLRLLGIRREKT